MTDSGAAAATLLSNKILCPAKFSNGVLGSATAFTGQIAYVTASWWCSDGSYNYVDGSNTIGNANDTA